MQYKQLVETYEKLEATSKRLEKINIITQLLKKTNLDDLQIVALLLQGKIFPGWDESKIGVASRLIIKAINVASGIDNKKIEVEWRKTGDLGNVAENLIKKKSQATLFSRDLSVKKVFENLRKLAELEGIGTVDKKIKLIAELLTSASPKEAKYIVRTVLEELRVGVGEGSLRDALVWAFVPVKFKYNEEEKKIEMSSEERKKYNKTIDEVQHAFDLTNEFALVATALKKSGLKGLKDIALMPGKPIKSMLFLKAKDIEDAFDTVGKPAAIEYKYDGFRCIGGYTPLYVKDKGFLCVRDIKKGDYVLTHKGKFREVLAVNKRKIDKGERVFEITSFYGNSFKISEGHPILVLRNKPVWINVENLKKGDKAIFPIPDIREKFPLKDVLELRNSEGYSKKIKITDFFFRFLGYWIGDGFTNNHHNTERVGLIFNAKTEKRLSEDYERNIKDCFGIDRLSRNMHNGAIYLYWRDKPFREWLSSYFRREWKGKTLPAWFMGINKKQFESFLRGWIESDGHVDKSGRINITTKERDLAMFASFLGLRFKRMIGLKRFRVKDKTYYKLVLPKSNKGYTFRDKDVLIGFYSIKELNKVDPRFTLYNLQIDKDESYCSSMISLHNCQIHKKGENITIFTRRLENVTVRFPEVVDYVKDNVKGDSFILDAEAVGFDSKTGKYLPFQSMSQRIKRKYDIEKLAKQYPVELNIFDIMCYENKNLLKEPFKERRKLLEKITSEKPKKIVLAKQIVTSDLKKADQFYKDSLKAGEEGIMVKNLDGIYKPGSRVGYGMKVKPVMESLDLVIVGTEWGEGKRSGWLTSFTIACNHGGDYLEIGKVGTGIKELEGTGVSFSALTKILKPLIIVEKGKSVKVKPKIIIEVNYEEIQKSPTYSSGYALRFPRVIRLREDKALDEISDIGMVEKLYKQQKR